MWLRDIHAQVLKYAGKIKLPDSGVESDRLEIEDEIVVWMWQSIEYRLHDLSRRLIFYRLLDDPKARAQVLDGARGDKQIHSSDTTCSS